jgi:hypothetical protein
MPALDAGIQGRKHLSLLPWIAGSGPGNDVKWVLIIATWFHAIRLVAKAP